MRINRKSSIKRLIPVITATAVLLIPCLSIVKADEGVSKSNKVWLSLGEDFSNITYGESEDLTMGRCALHIAVSKQAFLTTSIAGFRMETWNLFGGPTTPTETFNELAMMIGARFPARGPLYGSVSAGLAYLWGQKNHEVYEMPIRYISERGSGVGVPVNMQIVLTPFRYVGIGAGVSANFNSYHSYRATSLSLQFGKLW